MCCVCVCVCGSSIIPFNLLHLLCSRQSLPFYYTHSILYSVCIYVCLYVNCIEKCRIYMEIVDTRASHKSSRLLESPNLFSKYLISGFVVLFSYHLFSILLTAWKRKTRPAYYYYNNNEWAFWVMREKMHFSSHNR